MSGATETRASAVAPIQYELRIGVTGHTEFADVARVKQVVDELLLEVVGIFTKATEEPLGRFGSPLTWWGRIDRWLARALFLPVSPVRPSPDRQTPLKLTVISSLAPGADHIVTRSVCDLILDPSKRERYVEAVLPFPVADYEKEFSPADLKNFRDFMKCDCGNTNTHPDPTVRYPHFPKADSAPGAADVTKHEAFEAAGREVVDTSELVIAIWDPTHAGGPGVTTATLQYALESGRIVLWINPANLDAKPVLLKRAESDPHSKREQCEHQVEIACAPAGSVAYALPVSAPFLSQNFHRLSAYNRDDAVDATSLGEAMAKTGSDLRVVASASGLPDDVCDGVAYVLCPHFVRADQLANRYRSLRNFAGRLWPSMAAVVVSVMAFQIIFVPHLYQIAWFELMVVAVGYASYRVSLADAWHQKWLSDRRLAEGLRAAQFVTLASPSPSHVSHSLPFYSPATAWFVSSMKRVVGKERRQFDKALDLKSPAIRKAVATFLQQAWILPQAEHHSSRAGERRGTVSRIRVVRFVLIAVLASIAVLHARGVGHGSHEAAWPILRGDLWLSWATVALPAWAAAFHVISSLDDHERFAERSTLMASLLRGLSERFATADSLDELRDCVRDAERIFDLESAEWAESQVDRRPEFTG